MFQFRTAFILVSVALTGTFAHAHGCSQYEGNNQSTDFWSRVKFCQPVKIKGGKKVILVRESVAGLIDLLVFDEIRRGIMSKSPVFRMKSVGEKLIGVREVRNGKQSPSMGIAFQDMTGDHSPEAIFRVKNGLHSDLYALDLRRTDHQPELQFFELADRGSSESRNYLVHSTDQDVYITPKGFIGASASDPFLGVDKRFMALAKYRSGRMEVKYVEKKAFVRAVGLAPAEKMIAGKTKRNSRVEAGKGMVLSRN